MSVKGVFWDSSPKEKMAGSKSSNGPDVVVVVGHELDPPKTPVGGAAFGALDIRVSGL